MFRIDNATSQVSPPTYPSAGTPGHFTKGNPGGGVAATVLDDWWVDQVQEELCNVVGATGITLAKGTNTQLRDAILALAAVNAGTLSFSTTTALLFKPKGGGYLRVAGAPVAIPTAGLSIANTGVEVNGTGSSNLAANTTYDLYLKNSAGTLVPSFYTDSGGGTHMVDTTAGNIGTEVRSNSGTPDSTRTLIAKIRTDGSSHFQQQSAGGFINWFNKGIVPLAASAAGVTMTQTSIAEISSSFRVGVLCWAGEAVWGTFDGYLSMGVANNVFVQQNVDQAGSPSGSEVGVSATTGFSPFSCVVNESLTEGFHTISPWGNVSGSTATFQQAYNRIKTRG